LPRAVARWGTTSRAPFLLSNCVPRPMPPLTQVVIRLPRLVRLAGNIRFGLLLHSESKSRRRRRWRWRRLNLYLAAVEQMSGCWPLQIGSETDSHPNNSKDMLISVRAALVLTNSISAQWPASCCCCLHSVQVCVAGRRIRSSGKRFDCWQL
jgi:hypothetical protein